MAWPGTLTTTHFTKQRTYIKFYFKINKTAAQLLKLEGCVTKAWFTMSCFTAQHFFSTSHSKKDDCLFKTMTILDDSMSTPTTPENTKHVPRAILPHHKQSMDDVCDVMVLLYKRVQCVCLDVWALDYHLLQQGCQHRLYDPAY